MKTIEEKAKEYASNPANRGIYVTEKHMEKAYIEGANEALASQWRSADEELPEYNKEVLIKYRYGLTVGRYTEEKEWSTGRLTLDGSVYWMPFPEPPITREEIEFNATCDAYRAMRAGAKDENDLKDRINAFRSGKRDW